MKCLFNSIIDNADKDSVESKDEHCSNGNDGDEAKVNPVEAATEVDNTKDREEVDNII